ncbi:serine/threonine-protein kinase [Peristeroidobacter agariperforans]|uniref:serine/threonine-protein kinase n=1 Tax=Peristeroidobacter agariperforans TaxID=268404 RepID=UPI00130038BE|nr:serine/threonine-protein kinase [Peristeroidobacter agariperforans]
MTPDRWSRVKDLLCEALEQEQHAREAWLEQACADDEELHRELRSLIAAHEGPPSFIDSPAIEHAPLASLAPLVRPQWIGRTVGRYRILEEIGRGGMSVVFRAARSEEQFEHEVAIKLLHPSHDNDILMRRFRAERQMLARLSHPNIAHLLDGGTTEEGVPYLVMEYVRGEPVDVYCKRRQLDLAARLRLFHTLCDAVHYVHRHLMVHGDLKCSNVLVNEDGVVKLLDFGIARLLDPTDGYAHAHTTRTVALTPESASPEQIRGEPLTTASDVYALGVLLYRLLTGEPVYRPLSHAYYDVARLICERTPRRPSIVVQEVANAPATTAQLRGDLDTIILKALEKDPERRYASVEQLSQDIAWHLSGFPVLAAPDSVRYRLRKFVGRNRTLAAAAVMLTLSLIAGIVATAWQAHRAERERQRAERHFDDVRSLAQTFMVDVHDSITSLPGTLPARERIISHSLRYLDALAQENTSDPEVKRDLARAYERVGDLQSDFLASNLQNNETALASYRKSSELLTSLWEQGARDHALLRERLVVNLKLAQYSQSNRLMDDASRYASEALALASALTKQAGATADDSRLLANVYVVQGALRAMTGALDEGIEQINRGVSMFEQIIRDGDTGVKVRRNLAGAHSRSGDLLANIGGQYEPAYAFHVRALEIYESLSRDHPLDAELRKEAAYVLMDVGEAAAHTGRAQEGLRKRQEAVDRLRALSDADPEREELRFTLGWALGDLADSLNDHHRTADAARRLQEAQSLLRALSGARADRLNTTQFLIAMNDMKLGQLLISQADDASGAREKTLLREACSLLNKSEQVFVAANSDAVLAAEAAQHLRSVQTALQRCASTPLERVTSASSSSIP